MGTMSITLAPELDTQVANEVAAGAFHSPDELVDAALRRYLAELRRGRAQRDALQRLGDLVDEAGLYERTYVPSVECPSGE